MATTTTTVVTTTVVSTTTAPPVPTRLGQYEVVLDEVGPYITDERFPDVLMDVYHPAAAGVWPTVVYLHGGGNRRDTEEMPEVIASLGAVVFVPTWASRQTFERGSYDWEAPAAACAARFARSAAAEYGGDPDFLVLTGHSAGAILALSVTLVGDRLDTSDCAVVDTDPRGGFFVGSDTPPLLEYTRWGVEGDFLALLDPVQHVTDNSGLRGVRFVAGSSAGFREAATTYDAAFSSAGIDSGIFFDDTSNHSDMRTPGTSGALLFLAVFEAALDSGG